MLERVRIVAVLALVAGLATSRVSAQNTDSVQTIRVEEVLSRVRRLTSRDVTAARAVVDSLVITMPPGASAMPEALFAKASIAPSAIEAERDYTRIVNDHKFSPRVPDALMRLALLESARNNRYGALKHLERLLKDYSDAPVRSRASLMAGRLRLESNDPARACDLLAAAYASAGANERDVRDQAETLGAKCPTPISVMAAQEPPPLGVARAAKVVTPTVAATPVPTKRMTRRDSIAAAQRAATARRDSVLGSAPATSVVHRDSAPPKPAVVAKRDSAPTPKPPAPVVRRDTAPTPVVVKLETAPTPKPVVVRRDTAPTPKPVVVKRDTAPPPKPVVVRRDTVPTPKPVVVKRDSTPKPAAPVAVATPKPATPVAPRVDSTRAPRSTTTGRFGVQFAAYNDKPGAEQYAGVLRERGIVARVEGVVAPFRVRAGRFATRAEAEAAMTMWKKPGMQAFVVPLTP